MTYQIDPARGCGKKTKDSFYLEGTMSGTGTLHALTWLLGDGLIKNKYQCQSRNLIFRIAPRTHVLFRPAASIHTLEFHLADSPWIPESEDESARFNKLLKSIRDIGGGDHVGENNYPTAAQFAKELVDYGPSRKTSPKGATRLAAAVAANGPLPICFSHKRIPIFRDEYQRDEALDYASQVLSYFDPGDTKYHWTPTWECDNWGMYCGSILKKREDQYNGKNHYMIQVLNMIDDLYHNQHPGEDRVRHEARKFLSKLRFEEQVYCASWITRVSYTLRSSNQEINSGVWQIPNIVYLDLDKQVEVDPRSLVMRPRREYEQT